MTNQRAAVFLDKDGTLVEDVPYNVDARKIRLTVNALEGLRLLAAHDYQLFVVSNQSGVARGLFAESDLLPTWNKLRELTGEVQFSGFYYCPHHPEGKIKQYSFECDCRKPAPGMILRAAEEHDLDLSRSWFVGDILNDVEAGRRAGCRTVLLDVGNETEWIVNANRTPHFRVENLLEAARIIVSGFKFQVSS